MNYSNEIFQMLGVEPNEEFKIKDNKMLISSIYHIDKDFNVWFRDPDLEESELSEVYSVCGILSNPDVIIIKLPAKIELTKKEQIAIEYARMMGCHWLAKDSNGEVYAYEFKPIKKELVSFGYWFSPEKEDEGKLIEIPLPFLSWQDANPYFIGD